MLDLIFRQTITLFNRYRQGDKVYWFPTIFPGVHLVTDRAKIISMYGELSQDNVMVHIMYKDAGEVPGWVIGYEDPIIIDDGKSREISNEFFRSIVFATGSETGLVQESKPYILPKEYARKPFSEASHFVTFGMGDHFDFFIEGPYSGMGPIDDDDYREGFYNYMSRCYDNVWVVTRAAKYSLIPHFEITGR